MSPCPFSTTITITLRVIFLDKWEVDKFIQMLNNLVNELGNYNKEFLQNLIDVQHLEQLVMD